MIRQRLVTEILMLLNHAGASPSPPDGANCKIGWKDELTPDIKYS